MIALVALIVIKVLLPILLFIALYLGFMRFRGLFQRSNLTPRELGLLIVGSAAGMFSNLPIFVASNYLLALNIGGSLIPLVLSFYFLKDKNIGYACGGIALVAGLTFLVTRFEPGVGVVSEFHLCFIPTVAAILFSIAVYKRNVVMGAPFGYAIASLGSLIGADILRLPQVFTQPFMGVIGGAGVYDMVFISGLLTMSVIFLLSGKELRGLPRMYSEDELSKLRIDNFLERANITKAQQRYQVALCNAYNAIVEKLSLLTRKFNLQAESLAEKLQLLNISPVSFYNFSVLSNELKKTEVDFHSAEAGVRAGELIVEELNLIEKKSYASLGRRAAAFLLDATFMITILIVILLLGAALGFYTLPAFLEYRTFFTAWLMFALVLQLLYFTVFETLFKASPGKILTKIKVLNEDFSKLDFLGAFTRNVVRFLDTILLYIPSAVMIVVTNKSQRIGDYVAGTVVVRV
ncbi:MAG: DUF1614 domain-containing protein [Candidatus Thermoplasmatota archaeon]